MQRRTPRRATGLNILANAPAPTGGHAVDLRATGLTITAAGEGDDTKKGPRKFTMNAYNGGPMNLSGWYSPVVIDLQGIAGVDKTRPIFLNHDSTQIVGHTTGIKVTASGINVDGIVSGTGDAAKEVLANHDNGFPWQASVGARATNVERVPEGSSATVNGKSFNGPINIARKSVLGEISFVPLGADDSTSARIAAVAADGVPMPFEQWLKAQGFTLADLSDQQKKTLKAAYDAEQRDAGGEGEDTTKAKKGAKKIAAAAGGDDDDDAGNGGGTATLTAADVVTETQKLIRAERKRTSAIAAKLADYKARVPAKEFATIEAAAFDDAATPDSVELALMRAARPAGGPYVNTGAGQELGTAVIAAAAARSAGVSEKFAFSGLDDKGKEIAAGRQLRGIGLHQAMFLVAASAGIHATPGRVDDDFIRAMLSHDRDNRAIRAADGAGYSTLSLSGITENIMNKAMLEAYGSVTSVVGDIAYETDTNDFKPFKRYRLTASGAMQPVGPTGELKNVGLQDETYANQLGTSGCIIQVTRNILINDDMGALTQVPQLIGRQGGITREKAVFTALVGNAGSFFGTGNKNYISGSTTNLSVSSLATARQAFLEQKDANGDPIMIMPDRILVPPALETVADNLFQGASLIVTGLASNAAKSVEPNLNAHANKYRPIVTPWLGGNSPIANSLDTEWYLLGNPAGGMATVQIGYLRGQRTPTIERGEANFNTLGLAMRGYFDFGVALHDSRCGVKSKGAA